MDDLHEVGLGRHHRVDVLVRARRFMQHTLILPAFDAGRGGGVILDGELALWLSPISPGLVFEVDLPSWKRCVAPNKL